MNKTYDDLLLLSTSSSGLQKNIDRVQHFCSMWGLTINSDKSKVMVFSKVGRTKTDKFNFVINSSAVDYVTSYKYLGINISNTGKFALAEKKNLSLKASRALFSVKQSVFNNNVKPSVIFKIFDSLVKPIALYGSDVWFGYKKCFYNKSLNEIFEMSFKGHNEFDKIHTRFCKSVLGAHSKTSNFAVYSELGQIPLVISIISSSINFWLHTVSSNSDSILFKAYLEQIYNSCEKSPLLNFVKSALKELGFSHVWKNHGTFDHLSLIYSIKMKLKDYYISFWEKSLKSDEGKLRTYRLFKSEFGTETYLDVINDKKLRKNICCFRISAHRLHIERGRYTGTRLEDRLCAECKEIEDEFHFMFECQKYKLFRDDLMNVIKDSSIILTDNNIDNLIKVLRTSNILVLKAIGNYLEQCHVT